MHSQSMEPWTLVHTYILPECVDPGVLVALSDYCSEKVLVPDRETAEPDRETVME